MTDAIEFDAEPDEADYLEAARLANRSRSWIAGTLFVTLGVIHALFQLLIWRASGEFPLLGSVLAAVVLTYPLWMRWMARSILRQAFRRNPTFGVRRRVTLGDGAYAEAAALWQTTVDWRAFTQFRETPRQFLLFRGQHLFHMLPKRDIASALGPGGVDAVRDRLAARLKSDDPRPGFEVLPKSAGA